MDPTAAGGCTAMAKTRWQVDSLVSTAGLREFVLKHVRSNPTRRLLNLVN